MPQNDGSELQELLQVNASEITLLRSQYKAALELIEELDITNHTLKAALDIAMSENQRLTKIVEDYEEK